VRHNRGVPITIDAHVAITAIERVEAGAREPARDEVAVEEPLEIRVDGGAIAIMMRTPGEERGARRRLPRGRGADFGAG